MKENLKRLFTGCLTVPNLLSLIRIILIPVFGVLFYHDHVLAAVIVLAVSGLTDLFDGKIARRFNQVDNGILWCYDSCYCIRTGSRSSQSVFYAS